MARAAAEPGTRSQGGFTLVEIMVTVTIMSLAFVTILEGEAVFFHSTTVRRATASLDTGIRDYSTALTNLAYVNCAASYAPAAPTGTTAALTIDYWNGDAAPGHVRESRRRASPTAISGVQRLHITLTDTNTSQTDQLTIVKRKP